MPVPEPIEVPPELLAAKEAVEAELLARPGVSGVGVGLEEIGGEPTGRLAIRVMVEHKHNVPEEEAIPSELLGFPTDVVEARFEMEQLPDLKRYDPLVGGISGGPCNVIDFVGHTGTLGGVVRENASGRFMMISNAHVLGAAGSGDAMQPEIRTGHCPADAIGPIVASSLADPAAVFTVDAAVARLDGPRSSRPEIVEVGAVRGTAFPAIGLPVRKRGKSTGLTFGHIFDVELTLINDSRSLHRQFSIRVDEQHSTAWSRSGDSGALVVTTDNRVVGLHWGSAKGIVGAANPIHHVERVLDVSVAFKPLVTGMSPLATWVGPLASSVTLTGRGFQGGNLLPMFTQTQVLFGARMGTITTVTDDMIVVTPPLELFPTQVDVVVRYGWEQSDPVVFTYETVPLVSAVTPTQGSSGGGEAVSIFGVGLAGAHRVAFGDNDAEVTSVSDTVIQVVTPPAIGFGGPVDVAVWKDSGRSAPWFGAQFLYM